MINDRGAESAAPPAMRGLDADKHAADAYAAAASGRRRTLDETRAVLCSWFADRLGASAVDLTDLRYPVGAGTSSETILATARWTKDGVDAVRDVVIRVHPDRFQLFRDPEFMVQYRVLDVLHRHQLVTVPEPIFVEEDPAVLGLPFFVMTQLRGNVPVSMPPYNAQGFLFDATPAQRRTAWTTAMDELCNVATVPPELVTFLDKPELGPSGLEQQLEYWRRSIEWSTAGSPNDVFWQLYEWLAGNVPDDRTDGLAWGDARIGNMMFGDDFRLTGVMDWEQANFGGPRQDLGWWLFFDHFHGEGRGLRRLDGLGTRAETIEMWEDRVGLIAGDTLWYEVFTGFKVGLLTVRTFLLMGDGKVAPGLTNAGLLQACGLLGIAAPAAGST